MQFYWFDIKSLLQFNGELYISIPYSSLEREGENLQ